MAVNFYNGYIADTPATAADPVRVSVPNLTQMNRVVYGPLPWRSEISNGGTVLAPTRGDSALIAVDDSVDGDQWIVSWQGSRASVALAMLADLYANRPVASSILNGTRFFATDKMMEWQCIAASWVLVNILAPEVTNLPSSPIDQQECIYVADATLGVKWHFRYRSASASTLKWECIGGSVMQTEVTTGETTTSTTFVDLATVGPTLTPPLTGDYEIEWGADGNVQVSTGVLLMGIAYTDSNNVAQVAQSTTFPGSARAGGDQVGSQASTLKSVRLGLKNGTNVTAKYRVNAGTGYWEQRWIKLRPIRVT